MEILVILKRRWLISALLLALLIPSAVWASGADTTITSVKRFNNSNLDSSFVRLVYGSTVNYAAIWDFTTSTFGFGPGTGDNVAVKATAWDSDTPAVAPDINKHYGFLNGSTSGAGELPSAITGSIIAKYRAYMPFAPQVTSVSEVKTTNLLTDAVSGNLTVSGRQQLPGNGEDAEISTYHWRYRVGTGVLINVLTSGNLVISEAEGPATYYFSLALENQWGKTDYSPEEPYSFGGADSGAASLNLTFSKQADGLGINTFPVPFSTISSAAITNVKQLAEYIIANNDPENAVPAISTIGWWDDDAMKPVGYRIAKTAGGDIVYTASAGVDADPAKELLSKDKVYQVSVTRAGVDLNLTGTR